MGLFTGRDGRVLRDDAEVADISAWSLLTASRGKSYASSATGGYRRRLPGVKEATGKIAGKLGAAPGVAAINPPLVEGETVVLKLHVSPAHFYEVPAVVDSVRVVVDVERDEIVGWEAEFTADGPWIEPAFA